MYLELHVHRYSCVTDAKLNTVSFECTSWKIVDLLKLERHRLNKQTNKMNRTVRSEQVKFLFMVADGMLRQIKLPPTPGPMAAIEQGEI